MSRKRMNPAEKKQSGAPRFEYDADLAKEICFMVATTTLSLNKILDSNPDFPKLDTFYNWLYEEKTFADSYREAKERQQCTLIASQDEHIQWAKEYTYKDKEGNDRIDSGAIAWAKLKCDNIKWAASRLAPTKYGEKIQVINTDAKVKSKDKIKAQLTKIKKHERDY